MTETAGDIDERRATGLLGDRGNQVTDGNTVFNVLAALGLGVRTARQGQQGQRNTSIPCQVHGGLR